MKIYGFFYEVRLKCVADGCANIDSVNCLVLPGINPLCEPTISNFNDAVWLSRIQHSVKAVVPINVIQGTQLNLKLNKPWLAILQSNIIFLYLTNVALHHDVRADWIASTGRVHLCVIGAQSAVKNTFFIGLERIFGHTHQSALVDV